MYTFNTRALGLLIIGGLAGPIGAEVYEPTSQLLSAEQSEAVAAGDMDGDGDLDLVFGHSGSKDSLWLNDGSGQFSDSGQALADGVTTSLRLVDVDDDGHLDIFAGGGYATSSDSTLNILINDGGGNFSNDHTLTISGSEHGDWNIGDFNNDGHLDIAVLTFDIGDDASVLSTWYGSASGYENTPDETVSLDGYYCLTLGIADLTGDAADEVVVGCEPYSDIEVGGIQVFQHDGAELASTTNVLETDWGIDDLAFPNLNDDDDRDIVANHYNTHISDSVTGKEHSAWVNDSGTFKAANFDLHGIGSVDVADMNDDGLDDVVVADGDSVKLYCGTDGADLAFASGAVDEGDAYAVDSTYGDFDGDGKLDLALASVPDFSDDRHDRVLLKKNDQDPCEGAVSISEDDSSDNDDSDSEDGEGAAGGGALGPAGLLALIGLWAGRLFRRTTRT